jgi:hypothetical protein
VSARDSSTRQTVQNRVLRARISRDGSYELVFPEVRWRLEGQLLEPSTVVEQGHGKDAIGDYDAVSVKYLGDARTAEIRVYKTSPMALLRDVWNKAGQNDHPFPTFKSLPAGLMKFSYQQRVFGIYEFGALGPEGPWSIFDNQENVLLLSPADHFQVSRMEEAAGGEANSRILQAIQTIPGGFSHGTLIVFGKGMNETFATWGNALLALSGKPRPANDANVVLAKLGYWTDNGAKYYYKFEPRLGYAGTLLAVRDQFAKLGMALGYMQLDSWWYPKGVKGRWDSVSGRLPDGEYTYDADKELFPDGLSAFHQSLGLPMATHARWISPASPYHRRYKMSNNVIVDPEFWKTTAAYLSNAGVVTYEQDWLNENARPELNLKDPQAFLGEMSEAMLSKGITIQYCMPLPSEYMASSQYKNVQTIRPSDDRFDRNEWDSFLYDSRLASAVGLWPWTDVFFSDELGNLIISTLSEGPVGVGDALGETNARNLAAVIRRDGVIVKPDTPLLPVDSMYTSDARNSGAPMVAMAESAHGKDSVRYVFGYARSTSQDSVNVPLRSLGVAGQVFAYDWMAHTGEVVPDGGSLRMKFQNGWDYQILSPINRKGLSLLGDADRIVPMGKQRIPAVEDRDALTATVKFASGEDTLAISGYATRQPRFKALKGKLKNSSYDTQTKMFRAQLAPDSGEAILKVSAQ